MLQSRRKAKAKAQAIKTLSELNDLLDELAISDEERHIAFLIYGKGMSLTQVSMETGYSVRQVSRKLAKVQDKMG